MKFYTKIPKNPSNVSRISSLTGEYQDYLEHGFVYDKLPAYKPKRGTLFQVAFLHSRVESYLESGLLFSGSV